MIWIRKRVRSNECGVILPQFLKLEIMILLRGKSKTTHKEGSSYIILRASYMESCSPSFMKWFSRHRTFVNEGVRTFSVRILWTVTSLCKWYNWLNFLPSSLPLPWVGWLLLYIVHGMPPSLGTFHWSRLESSFIFSL